MIGICTTEGALNAGSAAIPPEIIAPLPKIDHMSVPVCVCSYSCKVIGLQSTLIIKKSLYSNFGNQLSQLLYTIMPIAQVML